MIQIRLFNKSGIDRFKEILMGSNGNSFNEEIKDLMYDEKYIQFSNYTMLIDEKKVFVNRFELGEYLYKLFKDKDIYGEKNNEVGFWTFLSAVYIDQVCPVNSKGHRKIGELHKYIFTSSSRRYYKHMIAGSFYVYSPFAENPEICKVLLNSPLHEISEVYKEITERPSLITSKKIVELVYTLYYDKKNNILKRGASGHSKGGVRRLARVLMQFDCTYDLYSINVNEFKKLLPKEFDQFIED